MNKNILWILCGLLFLGCDDKETFDCLKKAGDITGKTVGIDSFQTLIAYDGIDIQIKPSNRYKLKIIAGENVLPSIQYKVNNGELSIKDKNFCNWVRKYGNKKAVLYTPGIKKIIQNGYGRIYSRDTLVMPHLSIDGEEGPGNINLLVKTKSIYASTSRYGTITLKGFTNALNVRYFSNNAIFEGRDLIARKVKFFHKSNNTFHVHPVERLQGTIIKKGNIIAYHKPVEVDIKFEGSGKLIYRDSVSNQGK